MRNKTINSAIFCNLLSMKKQCCITDLNKSYVNIGRMNCNVKCYCNNMHDIEMVFNKILSGSGRGPLNIILF